MITFFFMKMAEKYKFLRTLTFANFGINDIFKNFAYIYFRENFPEFAKFVKFNVRRN